jgi:hypothetical protein
MRSNQQLGLVVIAARGMTVSVTHPVLDLNPPAGTTTDGVLDQLDEELDLVIVRTSEGEETIPLESVVSFTVIT